VINAIHRQDTLIISYAVGRHAALAPISENITPRDWHAKRSELGHSRTLAAQPEKSNNAETSGGFRESRIRTAVLARFTDPARPSTGHLRHGSPHARTGAGTRSQVDMNMKMESLLSRARESQAQSRELQTTLPRHTAASLRTNLGSAYQQ